MMKEYGYIKDIIDTEGSFFGERALSTNNPRGATILPRKDCELLVITTQVYEKVAKLFDKEKKELETFTRRHFPGIAQIHSSEVLDSFLRIFHDVSFTIHQTIVEEGQESENFYIITEGECEISRRLHITENKGLGTQHHKHSNPLMRRQTYREDRMVVTKVGRGFMIGEELFSSF